MKTLNDMARVREQDPQGFFRHRSALQECLQSLHDCYDRCMVARLTPDATAAEWVARDGLPLCREALCSAISYKHRDGRLDRAIVQWAQSGENAWDPEAAGKMRMYTDIHPTHLNQIASSFRRLFG